MRSPSPRSARLWMGLALLGALTAAGCRSDGGFGRSDSPESRHWAASRVSSRTQHDMKATSETLSGIPEALSRNWDESVNNLNRSRDLYVGKRSFPKERKAQKQAETQAREQVKAAATTAPAAPEPVEPVEQGSPFPTPE